MVWRSEASKRMKQPPFLEGEEAVAWMGWQLDYRVLCPHCTVQGRI
jgi:hypothetical protein